MGKICNATFLLESIAKIFVRFQEMLKNPHSACPPPWQVSSMLSDRYSSCLPDSLQATEPGSESESSSHSWTYICIYIYKAGSAARLSSLRIIQEILWRIRTALTQPHPFCPLPAPAMPSSRNHLIFE